MSGGMKYYSVTNVYSTSALILQTYDNVLHDMHIQAAFLC